MLARVAAYGGFGLAFLFLAVVTARAETVLLSL